MSQVVLGTHPAELMLKANLGRANTVSVGRQDANGAVTTWPSAPTLELGVNGSDALFSQAATLSTDSLTASWTFVDPTDIALSTSQLRARIILGGQILYAGWVHVAQGWEGDPQATVTPGMLTADQATAILALRGVNGGLAGLTSTGTLYEANVPSRLSATSLATGFVPTLPLLSSVTSAAALTKGRLQPVDATSAAVTMTALPALSSLSVGDTYSAQKTDSGPNSVTVPFASGDATPSGQTSVTLLMAGTVVLQVVTPASGTGKIWRVVEHIRSDTSLVGTFTPRRHPKSAGVGAGTQAQLGREVVGIDPVADQGYVIDGSQIYQIDQVSTKMGTWSTQVARGMPPGCTDATYTSIVYRWKGKLFCFGKNATDGLVRLYVADPMAIGTTGNLSWAATGLVLASGAWGFYTNLVGDGSYLFVLEYGDPSGGPSLWRSADGTTWTNVKTISTTRHGHCVALDPYNPGHVWVTYGDGNGIYIIRSTDYGATWTNVSTDGTQQCVQISFDANRIYFASDSDYGSGFFVERTDLTKVRLLSTYFHWMLPVPPQVFADGTMTSGSNTLTSNTAQFTAADTGRVVTGFGIPANTTMTYVSGTQVTLSNNATATRAANGQFYLQRPNERWYTKAWFGAVDPSTGVFYFVANSSSTGGVAAGLFCIPAPGMPPALLERFQGGATDPLILYAGYLVSGKHVFPLLQT